MSRLFTGNPVHHWKEVDRLIRDAGHESGQALGRTFAGGPVSKEDGAAIRLRLLEAITHIDCMPLPSAVPAPVPVEKTSPTTAPSTPARRAAR